MPSDPTPTLAEPGVAAAAARSSVHVPGYVLLRLLGEGGMGAVYLAEQREPVRRTVALKVIRAGQAASSVVVARFELERQLLALMQHPGIAQLYDAGLTEEGEPWFAMEHVDGEPITAYCDRHRLDLRARLRLFQRVCAAVQHAHQKGILHRDLKPSNLLVTERDGEAVPKVIDFGIAKALSGHGPFNPQLTQLDQTVGTLAYMSPEQLDPRPAARGTDGGGLLDTRSDVYALGVVLYDLLVGAPTFESARTVNLLDQILHQEPTPLTERLHEHGPALREIAAHRGTEPAALARALAGDLEWIVRKALEKNPADRYASVSELAADLERHLTDQTVLAGPPRLGNRLRKLVRRHRLAAGATILVLLSLLGGVVGTSLALVEAREAEARAAREARKAGAVNDFLNEMLGSAAPEADGREIKVAEVLDRAVERLDGGDGRASSLAREPEVEAALRHTLGKTYAGLGDSRAAEAQLRRAIELRRAATGPPSLELLDSLFQLGVTLDSAGRSEEAERVLADAAADLERQLGADAPQALEARATLAGVYLEQSRLGEAEALLRDCLARAEAALGPDHLTTLSAQGMLVLVLSQSNRFAEASALGQSQVATIRRTLGPTHPQTLSAINNLANALANQDQRSEAEELLRQLVADQERVRGPEHPETLTSRHNLAVALTRQGKHAEAAAIVREVLALRLRLLGPSHPHTLASLRGLGMLTFRLGRHDEAEPLLVEGYEKTRAILGADHHLTGIARSNLRKFYEATGRRPSPTMAADLEAAP